MTQLKVLKMWVIAICLSFFATDVSAQYKDFKINVKGDTINIIDKKGNKEGKWVIRMPELRGEPGYEEEGIFEAGAKEGFWRRYTLQGDLLAVENYKKGGKHGVQQYFTFLGEPLRDESWKGYDPDAPFDTVAVYGTGSNEIVEFRIVKAEQYSVKQGEWRFYDPSTGAVVKTENWERNNLMQDPGSTKPSIATGPRKKPEKTAEMLAWELKNKGKKNALRDGRTGL